MTDNGVDFELVIHLGLNPFSVGFVPLDPHGNTLYSPPVAPSGTTYVCLLFGIFKDLLPDFVFDELHHDFEDERAFFPQQFVSPPHMLLPHQ